MRKQKQANKKYKDKKYKDKDVPDNIYRNKGVLYRQRTPFCGKVGIYKVNCGLQVVCGLHQKNADKYTDCIGKEHYMHEKCGRIDVMDSRRIHTR